MLIRINRIFNFTGSRNFSNFIKKENEKITGSVVHFNKIKGYGFIKPNDGGPDIFVHYSDIQCDRTYRVSLEESRKCKWTSNPPTPSNINESFSIDKEDKNTNKKTAEMKRDFKCLIPGEKVQFQIVYDQKSHSSKAINVEFID